MTGESAISAAGAPASPTQAADERAALENPLAEIEQLYATAPIGLVLLDKDLRFVRLNHLLAELNGVPVEDHIGRTVAEIVPDLAESVAAIRAEFLAGGGTVTKLFSGTTPAQPGVQRHWIEHWAPVRSADGTLIGLQAAIEEVTERKREEERNRLLSLELRHRLKNTLTIVQAIARSTFKSEPESGLLAQFEARIAALAAAHKSLVESDWQRAEVAAVVRAALGTVAPDRVTTAGPEAHVDADVAMTLALALHELGTNAAKYGALSGETGRIGLEWSSDAEWLRFLWQESGGPPVTGPSRRGFGSQLLERFLQADGTGGELEFAPQGVRCRFALRASPPPATQGPGGGHADRLTALDASA
jgi:PAS domain S-box-containing protein